MKKTLFLWGILIVVALASLLFFDSNVDKNTEEVTFIEGDSLVVRFLDVGQADATIFHVYDDSDMYTIIYDVGDWQGNEVLEYLEMEQIKSIHTIIVSHPHADHIGQLQPILENFHVEQVWMTGNVANSQLFLTTMETLLESDTAYVEPEVGDELQVGSLHIEMLHPNELTGDLNDDSLAILVQFGEVKFLFTGDASSKIEKHLVQTNPHLQAQILHIGHHGSNTSTDEYFLKVLRPEYAIYSAGENNTYGHPHKEVIDRLLHANIDVYGTDRYGTITVTTDGHDISITPEKDEKRVSNNNCIDLNKASKSELQTIIHISEERAEEIIQLRPLRSVDQLLDVNGIGEKRLEEIKTEQKACIP